MFEKCWQTTNQAKHPVKSIFLSIHEFQNQNISKSDLKIIFLVGSNFRGPVGLWEYVSKWKRSLVCVSMLTHCGLSAASNCVVFASQTLVSVSASCTMGAFVFSLLSLHCFSSKPLCPHSSGEKGTCFRMLRRVSGTAALGGKHCLNLCQLVILRAYLFVCCFSDMGEGTTIYVQKLFLLPWVI